MMTINKIISISMFLLMLPGIAYADKFRILDNENNYFSYAIVKVFDNSGNQIIDGNTDKYGRITIELPNGEYSASVWYNNDVSNTTLEIKFRLIIDGSSTMKKSICSKEDDFILNI